MTIGSDRVLECPKCGGLLLTHTYLSSNTFRSVGWSDGYVDQPMMPPEIILTRCGLCRQLFWVHEAADRGYVAKPKGFLAKLFNSKGAPDEVPHEMVANAPHVEKPLAPEFEEAVRLGMCEDKDEELGIRMRWWWRYNDPMRGKTDPVKLTDEMSANLERMLELVDVQAMPLLKVEILRIMGEFDKSKEFLDYPMPEGMLALRKVLADAVDKGERHILNMSERLEAK